MKTTQTHYIQGLKALLANPMMIRDLYIIT